MQTIYAAIILFAVLLLAACDGTGSTTGGIMPPPLVESDSGGARAHIVVVDGDLRALGEAPAANLHAIDSRSGAAAAAAGFAEALSGPAVLIEARPAAGTGAPATLDAISAGERVVVVTSSPRSRYAHPLVTAVCEQCAPPESGRALAVPGTRDATDAAQRLGGYLAAMLADRVIPMRARDAIDLLFATATQSSMGVPLLDPNSAAIALRTVVMPIPAASSTN